MESNISACWLGVSGALDDRDLFLRMVILQPLCVLSRGYTRVRVGHSVAFAASSDHNVPKGASWNERRGVGMGDICVRRWRGYSGLPGWADADPGEREVPRRVERCAAVLLRVGGLRGRIREFREF